MRDHRKIKSRIGKSSDSDALKEKALDNTEIAEPIISVSRARTIVRMYGAKNGHIKMEAYLSMFEQDYVDAVIDSGRTAFTSTNQVIAAIVKGEHDVSHTL